MIGFPPRLLSVLLVFRRKHHSLLALVLPISNQNRSQSIDACRYFDRNRAGEIWLTAPSEIQLEKVTKQRWRILGKEGGESSGRDSYGDCGNICKGNLLFRVIFRKFMHRWFQICAQLGSDNVSFLHYRPPKLKYGFFRGSFSQPTSKSKWVGEPD